MIIEGGSRSNWRYFAGHLTKTEENERVEIVDIRGLAADSVLEAFRELDMLAGGTRAKNFFYHADLNTRAEEKLTPEQWEYAIDTLEANLGLTGQSRFVVEHEKEGRTHRHVIWSRIDVDTLKVIPDSWNAVVHQQTARALEKDFGHEPVNDVYTRAQDERRPDRNPPKWEQFRGARSGIDPKQVKAEVTELWQQADSGKAFVASLEEAGYIVAKGDRRDFVIIDQAGDVHSLAKRIDGAKAKDVRARMADVDRESFPSVDAAVAEMKGRRLDDAKEANEEKHENTEQQTQEEPKRVEEKTKNKRSALDELGAALWEAMGGGKENQIRAPRGVGMGEEMASSIADFLREELSGKKKSPLDAFADRVHNSMDKNEGKLQDDTQPAFWARAVIAATLPALKHAVVEVVTAVSEFADRVGRMWRNFVDPMTEQRNNEIDPWRGEPERKGAFDATRDRQNDQEKGQYR